MTRLCRTIARPRTRFRPATTVVAALAVLACLAAACGPAPDQEAAGAAADREIEAVYATFSRAYRQADIQLLMDSVYSDSAYYLPPGAPILHGREEVRTQFVFLDRFAHGDAGGPHLSFDITDRDVSGHLAYDIGVYTLRPPGAPEDAVGNRGKFIVIWKRDEHGRWRIHADGFSSLP